MTLKVEVRLEQVCATRGCGGLDSTPIQIQGLLGHFVCSSLSLSLSLFVVVWRRRSYNPIEAFDQRNAMHGKVSCILYGVRSTIDWLLFPVSSLAVSFQALWLGICDGLVVCVSELAVSGYMLVLAQRHSFLLLGGLIRRLLNVQGR